MLGLGRRRATSEAKTWQGGGGRWVAAHSASPRTRQAKNIMSGNNFIRRGIKLIKQRTAFKTEEAAPIKIGIQATFTNTSISVPSENLKYKQLQSK
ncbi:MAG: hypothetical protein LBF56_01445 [Holosporales bacterium]|nr:hypothetical protein [Holosporales bacterium]